MTELSVELRQLVEAVRDAHRPTQADSLRVFEAIQTRLGVAVTVAGMAAVAAAPDAGLRLITTKSAWSAVIAIASLALIYSATREAAVVVDAPASVTSDAQLRQTTADGATHNEPGKAPTSDATATPVVPPPPAAARVQPRRTPPALDSLSEEVALLSHAEQELHHARPERALAWLNEHERKYKTGALAEERTAARVQVLCALGRTREANAHQGKLPAASVHNESTRAACSRQKP